MSFAEPGHGGPDASVCKYYNPYFGTDCDKGSKCPYKHLESYKFIGYCTKFNRAYPLSPSDWEMSRFAFALFNNGEYPQALRLYKELRKLHPMSPQTAHGIAQCNEAMHHIDFAGVYYRRAISSNPNIPRFHRNYANFLLIKLEHFDEAQHHFEEALRLHNEDVDRPFELIVTHRQYALMLSKQMQDYNQAEFHYSEALTLSLECKHLSDGDALCIDLHEGYASTVDLNHGDPDKIHYHFKEALALSDKTNSHNSFRTHYLYALFLQKMGEFELSKQHFEASIEQKNNYGLSHFGLGELLCESMDYVSGLKHIQIARELLPHDLKIENGWSKWKKSENEFDYSKKEFNRFITEKIIAGSIGQKYIQQFEKLHVNDLRYFEFVDCEYLKTQIEMNALHIRLGIKQMDKFKKNRKEFDEWLKSIDVYFEYSSLLASAGILTFETFYKYINSIDDMVHIVGAWNRGDAKYIFENTPKHCRQKQALIV